MDIQTKFNLGQQVFTIGNSVYPNEGYREDFEILNARVAAINVEILKQDEVDIRYTIVSGKLSRNLPERYLFATVEDANEEIRYVSKNCTF